MNIVYYTSGITGSGRIVTGIAIGNALIRNHIEAHYTILSSSKFGYLAKPFSHIEIDPENEYILSKDTYRSSQLYRTLLQLNPDILIVDLLWFPLYNFIDDLTCMKIILFRQVIDSFFSINVHNTRLVFEPDQFDLVIKTEPFNTHYNMQMINPIIIRNNNEIFTRKKAADILGVNHNKQTCLFAYNGHPGDFNRVYKKYSYLEEYFQIVQSTNYRNESIFPAVDYFNAFDLIVCGSGYNQFWEAVYFNKEAIFEPTNACFVDGRTRIQECQEYYFEDNGADQLAVIIKNL